MLCCDMRVVALHIWKVYFYFERLESWLGWGQITTVNYLRLMAFAVILSSQNSLTVTLLCGVFQTRTFASACCIAWMSALTLTWHSRRTWAPSFTRCTMRHLRSGSGPYAWLDGWAARTRHTSCRPSDRYCCRWGWPAVPSQQLGAGVCVCVYSVWGVYRVCVCVYRVYVCVYTGCVDEGVYRVCGCV